MTDKSLKDIDLLPGEMPLKAWKTQTSTWGPFVSGGALNLTNQRLIWVRGGINVVPGKNLFLKLEEIKTCTADDGFNRHRLLLGLNDGSERVFHVLVGRNATELVSAIDEARKRLKPVQ